MKWLLKMGRGLTAVGFLCLFIQAGCQRVVDGVLFERHSVSAGSFRGIQIGSTKVATIESVRKGGADGCTRSLSETSSYQGRRWRYYHAFSTLPTGLRGFESKIRMPMRF